MKVLVDKSALLYNIEKAKALVPASAISVMVKSFYEYISYLLPEDILLFSKSLDNSVCYSINQSRSIHSGAVVVDIKDSETAHYQKGINVFYIPINVGDNREGLTVENAIKLAEKITVVSDTRCFAMITSGCINEAFIPLKQLTDLWNKKLKNVFSGISLGGSFYLQKKIPKFVSDVRIGEYMLFGTIPYCENVSLFGKNAITVELEVVAVYPERKQVLVGGGYEHLNTKESKLLSGGLEYVDSSSEYTIYSDPFDIYSVGDIVKLVPNYKSLVTLNHVAREYKE